MTPDLSNIKLADREHYAHQHLKKVVPQYAVVFENLNDPEASCAVLHPSGWWLAMAMAGGYLPPIEAYLNDHAKAEQWIADHPGEPFSWDQVGGATHPYAAPIGPMTEEESMEYLVMKDIPPRVWAVQRNRPYFKIVRREMVPADRTYRNAWSLAA